MATPYNTGKVKIGLRYSPGGDESRLPNDDEWVQKLMLSPERGRMTWTQALLMAACLSALAFSLTLIVERW